MFVGLKLDHFDGSNFTHWKDKFLFFLIELGVAYLIMTDVVAILEPTKNDSADIKEALKKHEEDVVRHRSFNFNSLSYHLYDLFHPI